MVGAAPLVLPFAEACDVLRAAGRDIGAADDLSGADELALGALVARCAALTSLIIDNNAWSFGATNAELSTLIKERKIQQLGMV